MESRRKVSTISMGTNSRVPNRIVLNNDEHHLDIHIPNDSGMQNSSNHSSMEVNTIV